MWLLSNSLSICFGIIVYVDCYTRSYLQRDRYFVRRASHHSSGIVVFHQSNNSLFRFVSICVLFTSLQSCDELQLHIAIPPDAFSRPNQSMLNINNGVHRKQQAKVKLIQGLCLCSTAQNMPLPPYTFSVPTGPGDRPFWENPNIANRRNETPSSTQGLMLKLMIQAI